MKKKIYKMQLEDKVLITTTILGEEVEVGTEKYRFLYKEMFEILSNDISLLSYGGMLPGKVTIFYNGMQWVAESQVESQH